jgi:exopolysaccharide production protein ExoY
MTDGPRLSSARQPKPNSSRKGRVVSTHGADTGNRIRAIGFENNFRDGLATKIIWHDGQPTAVGGGVKRAFDVSAAVIAILLVFPLFCLIALALKLWDQGPVLCRHRCVGLNGNAFDCLKFRTTVVDRNAGQSCDPPVDRQGAHERDETVEAKRDPRVTPLGLSMRQTSIDELPQLLNILKGEMSFVGPEPIVVAEVSKAAASIHHCLHARPGLTGPWRISGRNDGDYSTRFALDREYVEAWTLRLDLAVIAKTVRVAFGARGYY